MLKVSQVFLLILLVGFLTPIDKALAQGSSKTEVPKAIGKKYSLGISAEHYTPFHEDVEEYTYIFLSGSYKLDSKNTFSFLQWITKAYYTSPGENEVGLVDTRLRHTYKLSDNFLNTKWNWRSEITLPVSEASQRHDRLTRLGGRLTASKDIGKTNITARGFLNYYVNEYKTTDAGTGTSGGTPLREMMYGYVLEGSYYLTDKIDLSASYFFSENRYEQLDFRNRTSTLGKVKNPPTHTYSIDLTASYAFNSQMSASLGYSQGTEVLERGGNTDMYFYEQEESVWALGGSYTY